MDKGNITIGLPNPAGALYWAPLGTALPTDATTPLATVAPAYISLGYVTEDGLTATTAEDGSDITAWGPEVVGRSQTSYGKTFTFSLLETSKVAVLQFIYGRDNVEVEESGSVRWSETGEQLPRGVFVCETLQNNGGTTPRYKRQVVGEGQFTDRSGDHVYNNSDPLSYPIVLSAYKFVGSDGKRTFVENFLSAPIVPTP